MPEVPAQLGATPIAVTPERLHGLASEFRSSADTISSRLATLTRVADALSGSWSGQSHSSFVDFWGRSHTTIGDLCQAMYQVADSLDTAAGTYTQTDQQVQRGMRGAQ